MNPEDRLRELRDPDRWVPVRLPHSDGAGDRRVRTAPARIGQLAAAFGIALVVVVALIVGLAGLHTSPPAASPSPSASASTRAIVPPTFSVVPGPSHAYTPSVLPDACALAQLHTGSKQDGGAGLGTYYQRLVVVNSGSDCLIAPDAVRVGGAIARLATPDDARGLVVPHLARALLTVGTGEACQPSGTPNLTSQKPVLPIVLDVGGRTRTMVARFPQGTCERPYATASLDDGEESPALLLPALTASIDQPAKSSKGPLHYDVRIQVTGPDAVTLSSCPSATEVLSDGVGRVVTRALTLRCAVGTTLEPEVPVSVPATVDIPSAGMWTISWFVDVRAATRTASTTCTLGQLTATEPGPGGAVTGSWAQLVTVRNGGAACILPATAIAVGGRPARIGGGGDAGGFALAAGSTARLAVTAPTRCADGATNISSVRALGPNDKPVVLQLGGRDAAALDQPFPRLACAGPVVDRLG